MNPPARQDRALALDALRGLAILAMLLSGQLPFDANALPAWMYHAQVPPPHFVFNPNLPGLTWVDLVFPFFLFAMGASFPLALSRRMESQAPPWKLFLFVAERGFLLGFFALFVQLIRPYTLNPHPAAATWLAALLGFFIFFPILTRLPEGWSRMRKISIRAAGWLAAIVFCLYAVYPDGSGFKVTRSDIIIVVLTNMAVFGSLLWMATRDNLALRLGVLGIVFAIRLSNLPAPTEGWVHDLWSASPLPWMYQLYYLQYLCIVIPGTIAGDLILKWARRPMVAADSAAPPAWTSGKYLLLLLTLIALLFSVLIGLKVRWLMETTLAAIALGAAGWRLLQKPLNDTERLYQKLFNWAIYWLVLGLVLEPYEGGIKKDHPTLSYYFVTSGLALCAYIGFSIWIDVFRRKRGLGLLIGNGQNPMIAYAGINNFITPVLALTGAGALLAPLATTPWGGFCKGALVTVLMAVTVNFLTRRKIFWRT